MEKERRPWWLYLNLLGLDAPAIAVVWLFLFAQTWRVHYHPWEVYGALGLIVWTIRLAGKLIAGAMHGEATSFAMEHRIWMRRAAVISGVGALVLTVLNFPLSGYSYLLVGGVFVLGYFALALFATTEDHEISYSKHFLSGLSFAYGTALMAHVYLPSLGIVELFRSREFICFALLCLLASSATEMWAKTADTEDQEAKATHELALSLPLTLLGAAALVFAVQNDSMSTRPFFYGILTGAAMLQILNRMRGRFDERTVKVLTAVCLLAPGMIFQAYAISR